MTQKQKENYFNTKDVFGKKNENNQKKTRDVGTYIKAANKLLVVIVLISGLCYIESVNDISIKGFVLQRLKEKSVEITKKNESLELMAMNLKSYENISLRAESLELVKVDEVEYIKASKDAVAIK